MKLIMFGMLALMPFMAAESGASGSKAQEPAAPDDDEIEIEDGEPEETDDDEWPEETDDDDEEAESDEEEPKEDEPSAAPAKQTSEENDKYQAARLAAEAKANEIIARAERLAKSRGFDSWEEMEAENEKELQEAKNAEILEKHNGDPVAAMAEIVNEAVKRHPAVIEAQVQQLKSFEKEQVDALVRAYPQCGIKTLADIAAHENGQAIISSFEKLGDLTKAYRLENSGEIVSKQTAAAKQQTLNKMNSKAHLQPTRQAAEGGESEADVPADVLAIYRENCPYMTKKQAIAHYLKHH